MLWTSSLPYYEKDQVKLDFHLILLAPHKLQGCVDLNVNNWSLYEGEKLCIFSGMGMIYSA